MKWKGRPDEDLVGKRLVWHRWFAWFPIRTESGNWHWLEFVERKYQNRGASFYIYRGIGVK